MDSKKVLYFLGILAKETNSHDDEIAELYERALNENDDVQRLKTILEDHVFQRETGDDLYAEGIELIKRIYESPLEALDILPKISQTCEKIEDIANVCKDLIYSPFPTMEYINVFRKKDIISYLEAYRMIASTSVHLMLVYGGINAIKNLSWDDSAGIQEVINSINTRFIPALCASQQPNYYWVIRKKRLGGGALFSGEIFCLSYETSANIEHMCMGINRESIGTHAYLNIDAYEIGECDIPYCWGVGNIVSSAPNDALLYLQGEIMTHLRSPNSTELCRNIPTPFEIVRQFADGNRFCITAEELLKAMNQWIIGHEIGCRKASHNCLFCGRHVEGNKLVCPTHFKSEFS